jgi:hypothetical protein
METTLFAQTVTTPEEVARRVRADLEVIVAALPSPIEVDLSQVADDAVRRLWDRPIKQFVPVLALRDARERVLEHAGQPTVDGSGEP